MPVEAVEHTGRVEPVYNVAVADDHTYFVGDDDWGWAAWAHNACVVRPGMKITAKHGTKIYGTAQKIKGATHAARVNQLADNLAASGKYEYLVLNRSWRTATGRLSSSRLRPDIIALGKDGRYYAWEIVSPSNDRGELALKLDEALKSLPKRFQGRGFIP